MQSPTTSFCYLFESSSESQKRPQVRCDIEKVARAVVQKINYAMSIFHEKTQSVIEDVDSEEL